MSFWPVLDPNIATFYKCLIHSVMANVFIYVYIYLLLESNVSEVKEECNLNTM